MASYISEAGGYLLDSDSTGSCSFCQLASSNDYLSVFGLDYSHAWVPLGTTLYQSLMRSRWRDFGLMFVYLVANVSGAIFFYWLFRVPKNAGKAQIEAAEAMTPGEPHDSPRKKQDLTIV